MAENDYHKECDEVANFSKILLSVGVLKVLLPWSHNQAIA